MAGRLHHRCLGAGEGAGTRTHLSIRLGVLAGIVLSAMTTAVVVVPSALAFTPRGALRQLAGPAGCMSVEAHRGCGRLRSLGYVTDLAMSSDGRNVYVAASDSVVVFERDARTGRLTQLHGRGACVTYQPRAGCRTGRALRDPSAVAVSRDGRNVYVTEDDVGVAVFARDRKSGVLTQLRGPAGCVSPKPRFGCSIVRGLRGGRAVVGPDDRQVYVASAAYGSDSVVTLTRSVRSGALTQLPGAAGCTSKSGLFGCGRGRGLDGAASVAFSPDGVSAYVPSRSGGMAVFVRGPVDGALAQPAGPLGCVSGWLPVKFCTRVRAMGGANDAVVSADGRQVYVATFYRGVAVFQRDLTTGTLTQLAGREGCVSTPASTVCERARGIVPGMGNGTARLVLSADGRTLYASSYTLGFNNVGGGIAVLRRAPASGALRELPGRAGCLAARRPSCTPVRGMDEVATVALSPDGRFAYALSGDEDTNAVAVFAIRGARTAVEVE